MNNQKNQSGFEPAPEIDIGICRSVHHNPPTHLHIPQGQIFRYVCPSCGKEIVLRPAAFY